MENIKEIILKEENEFPGLFADVQEKSYGLLFFREDNKNSHDSNHAVLYPDKIDNLGGAIDDIKDFYLSRSIVPRIYHPFSPGYFQDNQQLFEQRGWSINIWGENRVMLLSKPSMIDMPERLDIRRLHKWDEKITSDIYLASESEYEVEVGKRSLTNENYYLFVGYMDDNLIVLVSLHISPLGCTRFDYIVTAPEHRGQGYGREILHYVTNFCRENRFPNCFQWPAHKSSERMCFDAGFRNSFTFPAGCAVYEAAK
jgi:GNAT superfamily N-acetyltransferase